MVANYYTTSTEGIGGQIKRRYADFIVEEVTPEGKICKVERFADAEAFSKEKEALKVPENPEKKEHLHLELEKINKDLNFVIRDLTRYLQCSKKRVGYAGLKDKRAVTCQRISLFEPDAGRLEEFGKRGIALRNPSWENDRINIGDLKGNFFTITIRDIEMKGEKIENLLKECFNEMEKNGIANYYGEQRFGGVRGLTAVVGKEFLKGDFEKGVMIYLTSTCAEEREDLRNARIELSKTNDFSEASKKFPNENRYERAMIHHLCKYPKDYVGAFGKLPKAIRYLFTHAYQSHLFNKVIDKRIEKGLGLGKIEGDIMGNRAPTAPLFGFESVLSGGKAGEIEEEVLGEEQISLESFHVKKMPEISSKGERREIILFPENLKILEIGADEFFEGKTKAKISFYLPKGNYATIVLREIMKVPAV